MNPLLQKNKIDIKSLSPEEQRLFRLYGKLPSRSDHFAKHLKERKYFDSGDYALSKAGKADSVDTGAVGSQHPVPENIPHLSSPVNGTNSGIGLLHHHHHHPHLHHPGNMQAGSPVKESSFLHRETSADDVELDGQNGDGQEGQQGQQQQMSTDPAAGGAPVQANMQMQEGLPIRR